MSRKCKNIIVKITILSSMADDLMYTYQDYETTQDIWVTLKEKYGGTSTTILCQLIINFDTYKKRQDHTMRQHLREMTHMIWELKTAGHVLIDEQ